MPTQNNDTIMSPLGPNPLYLLGGADVLHWDPRTGSGTVHGGDTRENYDTNIYGDKTGGDRLFVDTDKGVFVRFSNSEDGVVKLGKAHLNFTGFERMHLGSGNDTVRAGNMELNSAHGGTPVHGLTLYTMGGNDNVVGSKGDDFIDLGEGDDIVWAGEGNDHIQASRGNDTVYGGAGDDNIRWGQGGPGSNSGTTGLEYGNDYLDGGAGNDVVNLWANQWDDHDTFPGGVGVDIVINSVRANGSMQGTGSLDFTGVRETAKFVNFELVWSHQGRDTLDASKASIVGGVNGVGVRVNTRWGNDELVGSKGRDTLEGGEGADTITGGKGNDLISTNGDFYRMDAPGDGDADTLIFNFGDGQDTVLGFDVGIDILDLGGRSYVATETDAGTLLDLGRGDSILLANVFDFI